MESNFADGASAEIECLPLVLRMLRAFDERQVRYVHWKSNTTVDRALAGEGDLDLLVHPMDRSACEDALRSVGVIRAKSKKDAWQADVMHFIGADAEAGRLVHVHLHYALPVGFDYDKNFVLPVVDTCLDSRRRHGPIFLPAPEVEYTLLVIRLILKHGMDTFLLKSPRQQLRTLVRRADRVVKGSGYREFEDLAARVDRGRLVEIVEANFDFIGWDRFEKCEDVVRRNDCWPQFFAAASDLKRKLRSFATHGPLESFLIAAWRMNMARLSNVIGRIARKTPGTGGKLIAFVGGDGAGKSTNIDFLADTLANQFEVAKIHLGHPQTSGRGWLLKPVAHIVRLLGAKELALALVYLRVAFDRVAAFEKAKQLRQRGVIVILDRLPMSGLTTMDCPRIQLIREGKFKRLASIEQRQYAKFVGVDCLIVLKLDPEIALLRRPEDDPEELRTRSGEVWNDAWDAPYAKVIDTGAMGVPEVRCQVLAEAWQAVCRRRFMVEIIGLSGAGKSTVVRQLVRRLPNTRTKVLYRQHWFRTLIGGIQGIGVGIRIFLHSRNANAARNGPFACASQRILPVVKNGEVKQCNFLFDQGPVFQYTLALKEHALRPGQDARAGKAMNCLDCVFFLDAPDEELFRRVKARGASVGRANAIDDLEAFQVFCHHYRSAIEAAIRNVPKVVRIDARHAPGVVVDRVIQELERL